MARKGKATNRRPQNSKTARSQAEIQRVLGLRSSNAAGAVPSGNDYQRRPKHGEWGDE
jgi:hypothetical protein